MTIDIFDSLFASKLHAMVEARKAELVADVASSRGVNDFAAYQSLVGRIAALDECLGMFQTIAAKIEQEGRR